MSWTAPPVTRTEAAVIAGERETLEAYLDYHRQTLLSKCAGLRADDLRRQPIPPSRMSLLGLVRHLSDVERAWFRRRVAGESVEYLYFTEEEPDADFDGVDTADAEADYARYVREVQLAREAVAGRSLESTFFHTLRQREISVRWVYLHMIEEYARHNGHADLLRERIDGVTGE